MSTLCALDAWTISSQWRPIISVVHGGRLIDYEMVELQNLRSALSVASTKETVPFPRA
jgi:hypothetical protein